MEEYINQDNVSISSIYYRKEMLCNIEEDNFGIPQKVQLQWQFYQGIILETTRV